MGIINMMIVVPQLLQTLSVGWIHQHLLGDDPENAVMLAGILTTLGRMFGSPAVQVLRRASCDVLVVAG